MTSSSCLFLIISLASSIPCHGKDFALLVGKDENSGSPNIELYSEDGVLLSQLPELPNNFTTMLPSAIYLDQGDWGILVLCSLYYKKTDCYFLNPWDSHQPFSWSPFPEFDSNQHHLFLHSDSPGSFWALGSWTTAQVKTWFYQQQDGWSEGPKLPRETRHQCSVEFTVDGESVYLLIGGEEEHPPRNASIQVLCKKQNHIFCKYGTGLEWTIQTYVELVFQNCRIIICIDRPDPSIVSEWPYKEHFCGTFNEISKLIIVEVRVSDGNDWWLPTAVLAPLSSSVWLFMHRQRW